MKSKFLFFIGLCLFSSLVAAKKNVIEGIRHWQSPETLRVVLDLSSDVDYQVTELSGPERIVIDIDNGYNAVDLNALKLKTPWLKQIRTSKPVKDGSVRLVLDLKQSLKPKHFKLTPYQQYGYRLVFDLYPTTKQIEPVVKKDTKQMRQIIVAIDAGHGGDDPGAIGPNKIQEKQITLAIAKRLKTLIDAHPGMTAVLTRSGDYFVNLRKRTQIARQHKADLFISIHADGFTDPKAHGASVWVLSPRGARSEIGRWLETKENSSDLLGGYDKVNLEDKDKTLASVLLDLSMDFSLKASKDLAQFVLSNLDDHATMHKQHVQKAGFVVLKSPDIPSILVETAFISNPTEEQLLNSPSYQQTLASSIFKGVDHYYDKYLAHDKKIRYVVENGDTLSGIAARYQVSLTQIRQLNKLNNDYLKIGQELLIP